MATSPSAKRDAEHVGGLAADVVPRGEAPLDPVEQARPVGIGRPEPSSTYSRRNTWWAGCDVYVWLLSTYGVTRLVASFTSSAVPSTPSGPGWLVARVSTMKLFGPPGTYSGSSSCSGTNTVPLPPLPARSSPWSKNWPNSVNSELYDAEKPASGATFGMTYCTIGAVSGLRS